MGVEEEVVGLRRGGVAELDSEHLVTGHAGQVSQGGGAALEVPDVHHETGSRVVCGRDELRGQSEVGDVGEGERLQGDPGPDLAGLLGQLVQLSRPASDIGQRWDGAVDGFHVRCDLDLPRSQDLCGAQQRRADLVR